MKMFELSKCFPLYNFLSINDVVWKLGPNDLFTEQTQELIPNLPVFNEYVFKYWDVSLSLFKKRNKMNHSLQDHQTVLTFSMVSQDIDWRFPIGIYILRSYLCILNCSGKIEIFVKNDSTHLFMLVRRCDMHRDISRYFDLWVKYSGWNLFFNNLFIYVRPKEFKMSQYRSTHLINKKILYL